MEIVYNGVHLTMCTVEECGMEAVFDKSGVDYLFTRHRIVGTAVVNGQAAVRELGGPPVSYKRSADLYDSPSEWFLNSPDDLEVDSADYVRPAVNLAAHDLGVVNLPAPVPFPAVGPVPPTGVYARSNIDLKLYHIEPSPNKPTLTVQAIRPRLLTPRAPLYVFANGGSERAGDLLLRSPPQDDMQCDAFNGPKPLFCNLIYTAGEADTFVVRFGIETYLNESVDSQAVYVNGNRYPRNPLLSNRFSMRHMTTEDQQTFIEVGGEARFRTDYEYFDVISPDDLRTLLFLPVPFGHVRQDITVEGATDSAAVNYFFRDRQQKMHFPAGPFVGATRIEALHTQTLFTDTDLLKAAANFAAGTANSVLNFKFLSKAAKEKEDSKLSPEELAAFVRMAAKMIPAP